MGLVLKTRNMDVGSAEERKGEAQRRVTRTVSFSRKAIKFLHIIIVLGVHWPKTCHVITPLLLFGKFQMGIIEGAQIPNTWNIAIRVRGYCGTDILIPQAWSNTI